MCSPAAKIAQAGEGWQKRPSSSEICFSLDPHSQPLPSLLRSPTWTQGCFCLLCAGRAVHRPADRGGAVGEVAVPCEGLQGPEPDQGEGAGSELTRAMKTCQQVVRSQQRQHSANCSSGSPSKYTVSILLTSDDLQVWVSVTVTTSDLWEVRKSGTLQEASQVAQAASLPWHTPRSGTCRSPGGPHSSGAHILCLPGAWCLSLNP